MPRNKKSYKKVKQNHVEETQFDPKRHIKTKGGHGFGMKRGAKELQYENSGVNLASVFGWKVPDNLKHIKEVIDKRNGK